MLISIRITRALRAGFHDSGNGPSPYQPGSHADIAFLAGRYCRAQGLPIQGLQAGPHRAGIAIGDGDRIAFRFAADGAGVALT